MKRKSTRREFIQRAALGVAVSSTGISNASVLEFRSEKNAKTPPLKLGLMTYNLGKDWDIETIIKNCTETGWVHAELRTTHAHGVEVTLSKQERALVKKRFEDSPLEAISLASAFQYHFTDQSVLRRNIEGTKEFLQLAADVGAIGIRVFPNAFPEGASRERTMEQIGKALAEVGEFGHNLGVDVRICVHGNGTNSIPVIKEIIDYSQSPFAYVNWNCNAADVQGEGFIANFNSVKDRIRGVHMHDMTDEKYPYRLFFKLLSENGYKGYCNAEVDQSSEPIKFMKYYRALFLAFQDVI